MQNYNQPAQGYQRPGSAASFAGQPGPPPPPPYGVPLYPSATPTANSQWAPPTQNAGTAQQQWSQPSQQATWAQPQRQAAGGYNPGTYGAMPGTLSQVQQQDQPPQPPPKPHGYPGTTHGQTQQGSQSWGEQPTYGAQQGQQGYQAPLQNTQNGQQGLFNQQGQQPQAVYQNQAAQQQQYSNAAPPPPPPPSQTPGSSYFPAPQARPGSMYDAEQAGTYSSPSSAVAQQLPASVLSPNEQQPAYIPPSLTGQGVQSYMPGNTNPMPGVYVPPPPDIPAWQQAGHAPLQGGQKKFKYTKPTVDPTFYAQGYQPPQQQVMQSQPPQQSYGQPAQNQFQPQPQHGQYHQHQGQIQPGQFVHPNQSMQQQFIHPSQSQDRFQQQPAQTPHTPQSHIQQPAQQYQQHTSQWAQPQHASQGYGQQQPPASAPAPFGGEQSVQMQNQHQQGWQPSHTAQGPLSSQDTSIQAPKPLGRTGTTPPDFVNQTSPPSQPVSPVHSRQSFGFGNNQSSLGRTDSVSSVALGAVRNQQSQIATQAGSPVPTATQAIPTPPPPRAQPEAFSALGSGGPSDWEHFSNVENEIDDEELFGGKKAGQKDEHAQSSNVQELPGSHLSPPSIAGEWPTPPGNAAQPASVNASLQRRDTYQPTPPPQTSGTPTERPPSHPPQQTFVMGDAIVATQSPSPAQISQPPAAQQQQPPPAQQSFVIDDGGWSAQTQPKQQTPVQQQQSVLPAPANNSFVMDDGGWGAAQQTTGQGPSSWNMQAQNEKQSAELRAKDDAYERLKTDTEKDKADLRSEIENLKSDVENARNHVAGEKAVLSEQIELMRTAAEKATDATNALKKERDSTIERLKEDAEGRDEIIKEREGTIADLRRQIDVESAKKTAQPTPADLVPDIDPWYAGSLERYIAMLRAEASEPRVEDKIQVFIAFLRAESAIRGLEYYSAPPPALPTHEPVTAAPTSEQLASPSRGTSNASVKKPSMQVHVPQQSIQDEPTQYSPGGRPILLRKSTLAANEDVPGQQSSAMSSNPEPVPQAQNQPSAILTPTSSNDGDFNKTPMQSPPEEQSQSQYRAYVPQASASTPAECSHRQSLSYATPQPGLTTQTSKHDEIFFGEPRPASNPGSRPTTGTSDGAEVPIPAPLSFAQQPSVRSSATTKNPLDVLANLLPENICHALPNSHLEGILEKAKAIPSALTFINETTVNWEKAAALARKKNDTARLKRQEESEARTDQLFNDNEIVYADIGAIEDEFKEKERDLKAQEDRDEYKTYVEEVFDKIYDGLQGDIKALMDLYVEVEGLAHSSATGIQALESRETPTTKDTLELLKELHDMVEARHEMVVQAVAERDKRYKKTEIQPLYAAGSISKMKGVEKHFENAEKQAALRAKSEKAGRIGEMVRLAEEIVVNAVGVEQAEADKILSAVKALGTGSEAREDVLARARETLLALKASSKHLLTIFNAMEIELNTSVLEAEIAQTRAEAKVDTVKIQDLEKEMSEGEEKLKKEFERRIGVLEQDRVEVDRLLEEKGLKVQLSEEEERQERLKQALEEAKRRNGHV